MSTTATIPAELRERDQWVLWRYEERGDGKATKVPRCAATPWRPASSTDPETWATSERAEQMRHEANGIGFVFTSDDPYAGIDLDSCVSEDGEIEPWAAEIVSALSSYTERTPSGSGLHIIVRGELRGDRRRTGKFEVYDRGRYFTMTGERIGACEGIEERQPELDALLARMFPAPTPTPAPVNGSGPQGLATPDDQELLDRAFRARNGAKLEALFRGELNGHGSRSEADLALCSSVAFWTGPDPARVDRLFRTSGLMREKWDEARGGSTYGAQTVEKALERSEFFEPPAQTPPKHAEAPAGGGDDSEAREALAELLGLPSVGLTIVGARIVGQGSRASADIYLSNGEAITFESLREFGTLRTLAWEIAVATGAKPVLKAAQVIDALVLLRRIAARHESFTKDQLARDWGSVYLQSARTREVNMSDRDARWGAFSELDRIEPRAVARENMTSLAHASVVLVHTDGSRFVRTGWFFDHVRAQDVSAGGNADIATRMERVGWHRRGAHGRIKATRKDFPGQLAWSFFEAPRGWEDEA